MGGLIGRVAAHPPSRTSSVMPSQTETRAGTIDANSREIANSYSSAGGFLEEDSCANAHSVHSAGRKLSLEIANRAPKRGVGDSQQATEWPVHFDDEKNSTRH